MKDLPIKTTWNLIWLTSKNLSLVASAFVDHINENKTAITETHFSWFQYY